MRGGGRCHAPAVGKRWGEARWRFRSGGGAGPRRVALRSAGVLRSAAGLLTCVVRARHPGVGHRDAGLPWPLEKFAESSGRCGSGDASWWRTLVRCSRDHDHFSTGTMFDHEGGTRLIRGTRETGARAVRKLCPPLGGDLRRPEAADPLAGRVVGQVEKPGIVEPARAVLADGLRHVGPAHAGKQVGLGGGPEYQVLQLVFRPVHVQTLRCTAIKL